VNRLFGLPEVVGGLAHIEGGFEAVQHAENVVRFCFPDRVGGREFGAGFGEMLFDIRAHFLGGLTEQVVVIETGLAHI